MSDLTNKVYVIASVDKLKLTASSKKTPVNLKPVKVNLISYRLIDSKDLKKLEYYTKEENIFNVPPEIVAEEKLDRYSEATAKIKLVVYKDQEKIQSAIQEYGVSSYQGHEDIINSCFYDYEVIDLSARSEKVIKKLSGKLLEMFKTAYNDFNETVPSYNLEDNQAFELILSKYEKLVNRNIYLVSIPTKNGFGVATVTL